jgi:hypothetical protein
VYTGVLSLLQQELQRLLTALFTWRSAGCSTDDSSAVLPREVVLIGGGQQVPLESLLQDAATQCTIKQFVAGPFARSPQSIAAAAAQQSAVSSDSTTVIKLSDAVTMTQYRSERSKPAYSKQGFLLVQAVVERDCARVSGQLCTAQSWRAWLLRQDDVAVLGTNEKAVAAAAVEAVAAGTSGTSSASPQALALAPRDRPPVWVKQALTAAVAAVAAQREHNSSQQSQAATVLSLAALGELYDCIASYRGPAVVQLVHRRFSAICDNVRPASLTQAVLVKPSLVAVTAVAASRMLSKSSAVKVKAWPEVLELAFDSEQALQLFCVEVLAVSEQLSQYTPAR